MALQPSTQSWRVICVRAGILRSSTSVSFSGLATSPSTCSAQSANAFAASAWYPASFGIDVPLLRNCGERSASENSCAMDLRGLMRCCAPLLSDSPTARTLGNHSVRDRRSQPAVTSAANPAAARSTNRRRSFGLFMTRLGLHAITARDHRAQVVPEARDDDLEHMDQNERDEDPRRHEMQRARRLPAAEEIYPVRNQRIEPR